MPSECCRRLATIALAVVPPLIVARHVQAQPTVAAGYASEVHGSIDRTEIAASFPTPVGGRIGTAALNVSANVDLAEWHARTQGERHSQLTDVGVTPQLRFLLPDRERFQPYVDFGIGAHWLSGYELDGRRFGSRFQFGDYIGLGARFGEHHRLGMSLRLLHESNCGTNSANSGLTTVGIRLESALP